ncbi:MAG: hypothetical protein HKN76_16330 [Saprospiraceae bacterium]|nr:hypothetical protein [Saprospiraceae bacterium]
MKSSHILKYICSLVLLTMMHLVGAQEFEEFKDDAGVKEFNIINFENNLNYVRGVMAERDERAVVAASHNVLDKTLHGFIQTEFMLKFRDLKIEAESLAATFKAQANNIPPTEVAKVKKAYIKIADQFNRQLVEIKRDFLDRKKMKMIRFNRDVYSNSLQYKLRELKDVFAHDFERVVAEVTGSDEYSAIPLAAILGLIKLAQDFTEYLVNARYEAKRVKEEHLNQFLIEPYRFRDWVEIETIEGDIFNNYMNQDMYNEDSSESFDEMDPFLEEDETPVSLPPGKKIHGIR